MDKSKKNHSWEVNEKIAAILERFLTPDAQVRHNVFLPAIGSPSQRKRQCDVVIEYGQNPRKFITIVEVQKRKRKPTIGEFEGWLKKKNDVGAQQLVCVSELGYPKSVIEYVATRVGPTVKLMTLKELEDIEPRPLFILPGLITTSRNCTINDVVFKEVSDLDEYERISIRCDSTDKMFSLDDNQGLLSLNDIVKRILDHNSALFDSKNGVFKPQLFDVDILFTQKEPIKPNPPSPEICHYVIVLPTNEQTLCIHYKNRRIRIKEGLIKIRVNIEYQHVNMPVSHFVYHQELSDGTLAWIATAKNPLNNQDIQIIYKQDKHGFLQLSFKELLLS